MEVREFSQEEKLGKKTPARKLEGRLQAVFEDDECGVESFASADDVFAKVKNAAQCGDGSCSTFQDISLFGKSVTELARRKTKRPVQAQAHNRLEEIQLDSKMQEPVLKVLQRKRTAVMVRAKEALKRMMATQARKASRLIESLLPTRQSVSSVPDVTPLL